MPYPSGMMHRTPRVRLSDALFYVPHEGTKAKHGVVVVEFLETCEQGLHFLVLYDGEDGTVHGWPCVAAQMRVATFGATPTCLLKKSVSTHVRIIEGFYHVLVMCLVVCYKY